MKVSFVKIKISQFLQNFLQKALFEQLEKSSIFEKIREGVALSSLEKEEIITTVFEGKRAEFQKVFQKLDILLLKDFTDSKISLAIQPRDLSVRSNVTEKMLNSLQEGFLFKMEGLEEEVNSKIVKGESNKSIEKYLEEVLKIRSRNVAKFTARNAVGNYYAEREKKESNRVGIYFYRWRTMNDERVRKNPRAGDHAILNRKVFRFDTPPVVDQRANRRANPGEDYNCRCYAEKLFLSQSEISALKIQDDFSFAA